MRGPPFDPSAQRTPDRATDPPLPARPRAEPYEVSDDADSVQMLTRSSQIGEFYIMSPPQVKPANGQHTCDMLIYDEESDRHVRITWADALAACCIEGDENLSGSFVPGNTEMANPTDGMKEAGKTDLAEWRERAQAWADKTKDSGEIEGWDGLDKDIRLVVARPFIEHLMHNVIMTVSGRDTGATLFGPADMQLSANTQVKTIEGHYTGHFKAVVTKPQNVLIMRDVACAGYVAGMNTTFFAREQGEKKYSLETARQNIQDRLSFADDVGAKYGSMLAFPATEQQLEANQGFDTVMSVTSRLLPWELTGPNARDHSSFPGGQKVYEAYEKELGLSGVHYGEVRPRATQTNTPTRPLTGACVACACAGHEGRREPGRTAPPPDAHPPAHARTHALTRVLSARAGFHLARQHKQRHVLPRPPPQVRP